MILNVDSSILLKYNLFYLMKLFQLCIELNLGLWSCFS